MPWPPSKSDPPPWTRAWNWYTEKIILPIQAFLRDFPHEPPWCKPENLQITRDPLSGRTRHETWQEAQERMQHRPRERHED